MDIVEFLTACLNEDEWWATEASRSVFPEKYTPGGETWQWFGEHDTPMKPEPGTEEYINEAGRVSLRSVERYGGTSGGTLPHFVVPYAEEVQSTVAGYLLRMNPARTLRRVAAYRAILEVHGPMTLRGPGQFVESFRVQNCRMCSHFPARWPCVAVAALAMEFSDRPGFNPEWSQT